MPAFFCPKNSDSTCRGVLSDESAVKPTMSLKNIGFVPRE